MPPELGDFVIGQIAILGDELSNENRSRIEVMPEGEYVHHQAGRMTVTRAHLEQLLADVNTRGDKIPLDYDHSFGRGSGSRAAGWFIRGSAEIAASSADPEKLALYADVQWTPQAAAAIRTGEYRFISPEWHFRWKDRASGKLVQKARLFAATLTNRPFFDEMGPVHLCDAGLEAFLASGEDDQPTKEVTTMPLKAIAEKLGLAADADEAAILAALEEKKKEEETKPAPAASSAFDDDALKALVASAAKGEQAAADLSKMRRDSAIDEAIKERKIAPAQREQFEALWASNPEETQKLLASIEAGSWEPIGSEGKGEKDGERLLAMAQRGSQEALYGSNPPEKVLANGDEFVVDPQSRKLHVEALKILEAAGKTLGYTAEEYVDAVSAAAAKEGIAL